MNIDDLLSPCRGFRPSAEALDQSGIVARSRAGKPATRIDRGPEPPSPESWEMFEFVRALTA